MNEQKDSLRNDHYRVSPTAKLVAYFRSFSDIPYARETSRALRGEETSRDLLQEDFDSVTKFGAPLVEARYRCFNPIIRTKRNILELAMGTSIERGLALTDDPTKTYVGTDLPDMLQESASFLEGLNLPPRLNHFLQPVNVLSYEELQSTMSHFSDRSDLAIIHEGLWQYLTFEEQPLVAENMRKILSQFDKGVWATPDITDKESRAKFVNSLSPEVKKLMPRIMKRITDLTGRNIEDNAFATEQDARKFFHQQGFEVTSYPMVSNLDELTSIKNLGWGEEERKLYEPAIIQRDVWVMRLR